MTKKEQFHVNNYRF